MAVEAVAGHAVSIALALRAKGKKHRNTVLARYLSRSSADTVRIDRWLPPEIRGGDVL